MGQACVKDKQTSQRSFSFDSALNRPATQRQENIRSNVPLEHDQPKNLFVSEQFTFDNEFNRRHEKLKELGKRATPKGQKDSDLNVSL